MPSADLNEPSWYPNAFTTPNPFVRPSLNSMRSPADRNSGRWTKRKATVARSPVRMYSRSMSMMAHVWLTGPTWSIAWYLGRMVVAWERINTSATNSRYAFGATSNFASKTIPLRTSLRCTFFNANEADWPAEQTGTGMRFRSIDRMLVDWNWPSESGPSRTLSPACTIPLLTTPDTTVPTYGTEKVSLMWNSKLLSGS